MKAKIQNKIKKEEKRMYISTLTFCICDSIILDPSPDSGVGLGHDAGERYEAYVSYVESPSQFWIQRADSEQTLEEIGVALENTEKTTVERKEIEVGQVFAARYGSQITLHYCYYF